MASVLVTGGTGHLGRDLVRRLLSDGHRVRVLSRSPQTGGGVEWVLGDLATGAGLTEALQGVNTLINAATCSPVARRGGFRPIDFIKTPADVDVDGTRRLLALSEHAGVQHFVHVSVVGLEDASLPYARVKLEGERLVRSSAVSWSVVRAMPFYYLLERILNGLRWLPLWPVPKAVFNPVDTSDVANYLAKCAFDGSRGVRDEIGGPEDLICEEFACRYQEARGLKRALIPVRVSAKTARGMGFCVTEGARGSVSWASWLQEPPRVRQALPN